MLVPTERQIQSCLLACLLALSFALALGWSGYASAADALECSAIDQDEQRLACYDQLYRQNTHDPVLTPIEDQVGPPEPAPPRARHAVDPVTSIVLRTNRKSRKEVTWHLANGEIWRQTSFRYITIRDGDTVTVKQSLFGGFIMSNKRGAASRVKRIQ